MDRKVYCNCDSDFSNHYSNQAGRGYDDIGIFRGNPYQRGYGLGSVLKRFGVPILKFFGKELLKTGVNVGSDILNNRGFKESLKSRGKESIRSAAKRSLQEIEKTFNQSGSGLRLKRKRSRRKKKVVRKLRKTKKMRKPYKKKTKRRLPKKKKDIFN